MRVFVGIFSVGIVLILAGCSKEQAAGPEPIPVKVETVATQEVRPAWRYSGEIRPDTEVKMAFKEPGYIAGLHQIRGADGRVRDIQVGDEIPAGAVLAHLRRNDYEAALNTAVCHLILEVDEGVRARTRPAPQIHRWSALIDAQESQKRSSQAAANVWY
jgi:multidrug efflux pump subunit AcrA (membrane-fusion protein)